MSHGSDELPDPDDLEEASKARAARDKAVEDDDRTRKAYLQAKAAREKAEEEMKLAFQRIGMEYKPRLPKSAIAPESSSHEETKNGSRSHSTSTPIKKLLVGLGMGAVVVMLAMLATVLMKQSEGVPVSLDPIKEYVEEKAQVFSKTLSELVAQVTKTLSVSQETNTAVQRIEAGVADLKKQVQGLQVAQSAPKKPEPKPAAAPASAASAASPAASQAVAQASAKDTNRKKGSEAAKSYTATKGPCYLTVVDSRDEKKVLGYITVEEDQGKLKISKRYSRTGTPVKENGTTLLAGSSCKENRAVIQNNWSTVIQDLAIFFESKAL